MTLYSFCTSDDLRLLTIMHTQVTLFSQYLYISALLFYNNDFYYEAI